MSLLFRWSYFQISFVLYMQSYEKYLGYRPSLPAFTDYSNWNNVFNLYDSCSSLHCPYNDIQSCSCNRSEGTSPNRRSGYGSEDICKSLSCGNSRNSCGCSSELDGIFSLRIPYRFICICFAYSFTDFRHLLFMMLISLDW